MFKILDRLLVSEVLRDQRLYSTAALMRVQLHSDPVNTVDAHARSVNMSLSTAKRAVRRLVDCGWAYKFDGNKRRSTLIVPWMPPDVEQMIIDELERVRHNVALGGEWITKSILDVMVDDRDFRDNARPAWLTLGDGSGRHEIDRWYRSAKVAIEFHGTQHYQYDPKFHATREDFVRQQIRDNAKAGLCSRRGIRYVEIAATELDFEFVISKIDSLLPVRPIPMDSLIVQTLRDMCRSYVNTVRRASKKQYNKPHGTAQ